MSDNECAACGGALNNEGRGYMCFTEEGGVIRLCISCDSIAECLVYEVILSNLSGIARMAAVRETAHSEFLKHMRDSEDRFKDITGEAMRKFSQSIAGGS